MQEMVAHIVAGYPDEACGLLASKDGQVVKNYPTANAAEHPDDFSIIDPEDLRRIFDRYLTATMARIMPTTTHTPGPKPILPHAI